MNKSAKWIAILFLSVIVWGCHSKASTPGPANYFKVGETSFENGDYASAITAYETYASLNPAAKNLDRVLYRLGLSYALPGDATYNLQKSIDAFQRLVTTYPASPYRIQAEVIKKLEEDLASAQGAVAEQEVRTQAITNDSDKSKKEAERLRTQVGEREAKIKQLRNELEQLKKVDLQKKRDKP